ncbi:MAG: cytidylate kinase-like family protein [Butyrivibrio sp.]|uniref:cytidylate kinase-like family protein n=1 Tax=Butyrivibrio sp. TaxID=28121 RepID=UPI0025DF4CF5|nr:cytidylate kinase-like family protein [Butyrivibrio sp.]MCR5769942.1 cytidylate kinase-like family protein [Butyrivibrio sp.]
MENFKFPVITIGREYCAYGRTIAGILSERLGIPYYDKDFVKKTVIESGFCEEDVNSEGESISALSLFIENFLNGTAAYNSYDDIFEAQKHVIVDLAKSPCIIVGRCADFVLKEAGIKSLDIYLYAETDFKLERARQLHPGLDDAHLKKIMKKQDELRRIYYKHYTGHDNYDFSNYDLCLNTGIIGIDKCADIIEDIVRGSK